MIDIQQLIEIDKEVLLALNGNHSLFWDGFMWTVTNTLTWIPLALVLLYVIFKNNKLSNGIVVLVMIALCITFADQIASGICKPYFQRFRPTQDPEMMYLVHTVNGYRGGRFGFISSHAANTFAVATFLSLLIRNYKLTLATFIWAVIASYSRIYLGVHYPGDILCGATVGVLVALVVYAGYSYFTSHMSFIPRYNSTQYTSSGYATSDIDIFLLVLLLSFFYAIISGMLRAKLLFF